MLTKNEVIDIIELIFFVPALCGAIYVTYKHGLRREAGWLTLVILSLARIVGASTGIAAVHDPSTGLITASFVCSSIGSTLLVASLTGIVNRVHNGTGRSFLPARMTKLLQLMSLAAVILSIIGGTDIASSNPDTRNSGHTYSKVAVILILVQLLATMVIAGFTAMHSRYINTGDRRLFVFAIAAIPFVLVRVIYSICVAFDYSSPNFSILSDTVTAVAIRGCLDLAMEIVAVTLFITGGILAPKIQNAQNGQSEFGNQLDVQQPKTYQAPAYAPLAREQDQYSN